MPRCTGTSWAYTQIRWLESFIANPTHEPRSAQVIFSCMLWHRPSDGTTIPVTTKTPRRYYPRESCRGASAEWIREPTMRFIMCEHACHISIGVSNTVALSKAFTQAADVRDRKEFSCQWRLALQLWPPSMRPEVRRRDNGCSQSRSPFTTSCGGCAVPK